MYLYRLLSMYLFIYFLFLYLGHPVPQSVEALRYKSEGLGSIPDGVIGIFHKRNLSCHTMTLGLTQPLT